MKRQMLKLIIVAATSLLAPQAARAIDDFDLRYKYHIGENSSFIPQDESKESKRQREVADIIRVQMQLQSIFQGCIIHYAQLGESTAQCNKILDNVNSMELKKSQLKSGE